MRQQPLSAGNETIKGIGQRFGFGFAAAATMAGIVIVLDRVGTPARLVTGLGLGFGLLIVLLIGVAMRTMRVSRFHAAGRVVPPAYAGLALGGLCLTIILTSLPPDLNVEALVQTGVQVGGGLALAGFILGPILRQSGAFSLNGLLGGRFPGAGFRMAILLLLGAIAALLGLASLQGASRGLLVATGFAPWPGAVLLGLVVLVTTLPGGLAGTIWVNVAAAGCTIGAMVLALGLGYFQNEPLALPVVGDRALLVAALTHLNDFSALPASPDNFSWAMLAAIPGYAVLFILSGLFVATANAGAARRSGLIGLFWGSVLALLALAMIAASIIGIDKDLIGNRPNQLPDAAYFASSNGEMRLCGARVDSPPKAALACAALPGFTGKLQAQDIAPSALSLISGLALVRNPPAAAAGLINAGLVLLQLALAAAAFQALAGTLAHDGFYRLRDQAALTSRRLAIARACLLAVIASAVIVSLVLTPDPHRLAMAALALAAGLAAPLLALALWPMATTRDAVMALSAGGLFAFIRGPAALAGYEDFYGTIALVALITLATGFAASLLPRKNRQPSRFFEALRAGGGTLYPPDKGA